MGSDGSRDRSRAVQEEAVPLRVGLRQLVFELDRAALIVVHGWTLRQLSETARRPDTPFVLVPDADDAIANPGESFLTMASRVRLHICRLPRTHLIVLDAWIRSRLG